MNQELNFDHLNKKRKNWATDLWDNSVKKSFSVSLHIRVIVLIDGQGSACVLHCKTKTISLLLSEWLKPTALWALLHIWRKKVDACRLPRALAVLQKHPLRFRKL